MRFGKSAAEAAEEPARGGGGSQFIRYLKEGDNTMRILQDPDEWTYYWEHFGPTGSFPCPRDKDDPIDMCPGCASDNEKMSRLQRRIAFNILHSFNGREYVDVMKVGNMVADKLDNRYKRFGTVTDRDYTITKYKSSGDKWDFDVEGNTPTPVDLRKEEWKDVEEMLQVAWTSVWGDWKPGMAVSEPEEKPAAPAAKRAMIAPQKPAAQPEEPPFEEEVYQEADLRKMEYPALLTLIKDSMQLTPPATLITVDAVVDWLMALQS